MRKRAARTRRTLRRASGRRWRRRSAKETPVCCKPCRDAAEEGKQLLREAEERAAEAAAEIAKTADGERGQLRARARSRMDEAAKFIVGRVVKS